MRLAFSLLGIVVATLLTVAMLFTPGWVRPPIISTQTGYRGTGQEQLISAQNKRILEAANALPAPIDKASPSGERATSAYKNVKVLTDLSTDEFNRLMVAITQWVSPDQGCAYCHTDDLADDGIYTKIVARRMIADDARHQQGMDVACRRCRRDLLHLSSRPACAQERLVRKSGRAARRRHGGA